MSGEDRETKVEYAYDVNGRLVSATYPDGSVVRYASGGGAESAPAARVAQQAPPPTACAGCGSPLVPGDAFCGVCGSRTG